MNILPLSPTSPWVGGSRVFMLSMTIDMASYPNKVYVNSVYSLIERV